MKILLKILITITFLITTVGSLALTVRNARQASNAAEEQAAVEALGSVAKMLGAGDALKDIPTEGQFQFAMVCAGLLMLGSIVGIVFAYVKNQKIGLGIAGVVILSALLLIIFQPSTGGRTDPRSVAMTIGIIALIGGGLLALLKAKFSATPAPIDTTTA